jgi:hypothetical protein
MNTTIVKKYDVFIIKLIIFIFYLFYQIFYKLIKNLRFIRFKIYLILKNSFLLQCNNYGYILTIIYFLTIIYLCFCLQIYFYCNALLNPISSIKMIFKSFYKAFINLKTTIHLISFYIKLLVL